MTVLSVSRAVCTNAGKGRHQLTDVDIQSRRSRSSCVLCHPWLTANRLQCTKNKTWKDIAAQLGIGASSSGAYTLKKHYGKNLPFECQFYSPKTMTDWPLIFTF